MPRKNISHPSICLAMIVRDESSVIARCLASALPYIDAWCAIDTGSTDNTAQIIQQTLAHLPGKLSLQPFSDFARLRSMLLQQAAGYGDYILMLDADEELLCLADNILPQSSFDAARVVIQQADICIRQLRIFRANLNCPFDGAVYERAVLPDASQLIDLDTTRIVHHADGYRSRLQYRDRNDIAELQSALTAQSNSAARQSLARALIAANRTDEAVPLLQAVVDDQQADLSGRWLAAYLLGLHYQADNQQQAALTALLQAYDLDPSRAEALYRLAEILGEQQRWQDAYELTALAFELACPATDYFEPAIYDWWAKLLHASFCIQLERFEEAHKTLNTLPPGRLNGDALEYRNKLLQKTGMQSQIVSGSDNDARHAQASPRLSIAMATYDDFDGVYFTVASILSGHPEVRDQIEIVVLDNHPQGACSSALKNLCSGIDLAHYVADEQIRGTAIKTHLFDYARGEWVLCVDSHVVILPGALEQLLGWIDAHPHSDDLLHGPMLSDNLENAQIEMKPQWHAGMFGYWQRPRKLEAIPDQPFEIQTQGMGLFACRREAWPGFNPRFIGYGGEEGYIQEKFRRQGGRVLCLPFLRWMHRFARPLGAPYKPQWSDWIRNYLIGFDELGLDSGALERHYADFIGFEVMARARAAFTLEKQNPFYFFDAIYCINLKHETARWQSTLAQAEKLGFAERLRHFDAIETPQNHHIGCALSHRHILQTARKQKFNNVLVLEDDVIFSEKTLEALKLSLEELAAHNWDLFYLGGHDWDIEHPFPQGCTALRRVGDENRPMMGLTCTHAIAYHHSCFDYLLERLPEDRDGMALFLQNSWPGIDQMLAHAYQLARFVCEPHIAAQPPLLNRLPADFAAPIKAD